MFLSHAQQFGKARLASILISKIACTMAVTAVGQAVRMYSELLK